MTSFYFGCWHLSKTEHPWNDRPCITAETTNLNCSIAAKSTKQSNCRCWDPSRTKVQKAIKEYNVCLMCAI